MDRMTDSFPFDFPHSIQRGGRPGHWNVIHIRWCWLLWKWSDIYPGLAIVRWQQTQARARGDGGDTGGPYPILLPIWCQREEERERKKNETFFKEKYFQLQKRTKIKVDKNLMTWEYSLIQKKTGIKLVSVKLLFFSFLSLLFYFNVAILLVDAVGSQ